MSENWRFQLSIKVEGQHLFNIRSDDGEQFKNSLAYAADNREAILAACAALEGSRKPEPARPASTPATAPKMPLSGSEREVGPIQIENIEVKKGPRDGPAWKSPMYVVKWEGQSASTFDALIGKAAMGFWTQGNACHLTVEPSPKNPRFLNLTSIRSAA